jgi:hypothetical protein
VFDVGETVKRKTNYLANSSKELGGKLRLELNSDKFPSLLIRTDQCRHDDMSANTNKISDNFINQQ